MIDPMWQIVGVMLGAGVFGGLVNFFLSKPDDVPTPSKTRSILVGTAASLLVPLFLNMISSNLIDLIKGGDNFKLLILLGFCLVASISSTAFIRTISDRVLTEAKQAKVAAQTATAQIAQVQEDIQPIVAKETEQDDSLGVATPSAVVSTIEDKILRALAAGQWALRSQGGLAKETGLDSDEVARVLFELSRRGLVDKRSTKNGTRWFITDQGRSAPSKS
jgi:hypothetical protein